MKKKDNFFDIIIIGAGLSGLVLTLELIKKTKKRILLLEKKKDSNMTKIGVFGIFQRIFFQIATIINGIKLM